jgi:hypothetical protein
LAVWDANVSFLSRITPTLRSLQLVKYYPKTWEPQWRPSSGKVDSLGFRQINFYLPSFEVLSHYVELPMKQTAIGSELDTNREVSLANVASSHSLTIGVSEVKK